jgi:hypothetical protein
MAAYLMDPDDEQYDPLALLRVLGRAEAIRLGFSEVRAGAWSAPEAQAARLLPRGRLPAFEQNAPRAS